MPPRTQLGESLGLPEAFYSIVEVHFDEQGKFRGYADNQYPSGEEAREVIADLSHMVRACALPVLDLDRIDAGEPPVLEDG